MFRRGAARLLSTALAAGALAALAGCSGITNPFSDSDYGDTGILSGGGFDDTGVLGFAGLAIPDSFNFLFGQANFGDESRAVCFTTEQCGVAGVTNQFGNIITSPSDSFGFVTTSNFFEDTNFVSDGVADSVVVRRSGIASVPFDIPASTALKAARLTFEYAFLTARNDPASHNDSALVRLLIAGDTLRVLKVTTADLQSGGAVAPKAGGCGTHVLGDAAAVPNAVVTTNYNLCSDWLPHSFDVSNLRGQRVSFEIVVDEVGGDTDQATAFLINKLRLEGVP